MIKKKLNILLLLLLVALFIGSYSISYAYEVTYNDCEKIAYSLYNESDKTTDLINKMWTAINNIQTSSQSLNAGIDTIVISVQNANRYVVDIYGLKSSEVTAVNNAEDINYMFVTTNRHSRIYYSISSYGASSTWSSTRNQSAQSSISFGSGSQLSTNYLFISNTLGNDLFIGPWQNKNILDINNDYFSFLLNSSLPTMTINNNSVPYYDLQSNQAESFVLGQLGLAENFNFAELDCYRYQNGNWKHVGTTTLYNIGTTTDNLISVTIPGSIVNSNNLYTLTMYSAYDSDFPNISQPFYIADRNTVITNGFLNTNDTFSGDYYNNYNNDTNTDKIINNINSGDNESVEDIINSELSGDADYIAVKLGRVPLDNPVSQYIRFILYGITDSILDSEEVTIPINVYGMDLSLRSDAFTIPNNTLKLFLKYCLEALFIWNLIKFEYRLFTALTTMDIDAVSGTIEQADLYYNNDWRGM